MGAHDRLRSYSLNDGPRLIKEEIVLRIIVLTWGWTYRTCPVQVIQKRFYYSDALDRPIFLLRSPGFHLLWGVEHSFHFLNSRGYYARDILKRDQLGSDSWLVHDLDVWGSSRIQMRHWLSCLVHTCYAYSLRSGFISHYAPGDSHWLAGYGQLMKWWTLMQTFAVRLLCLKNGWRGMGMLRTP